MIDLRDILEAYAELSKILDEVEALSHERSLEISRLKGDLNELTLERDQAVELLEDTAETSNWVTEKREEKIHDLEAQLDEVRSTAARLSRDLVTQNTENERLRDDLAQATAGMMEAKILAGPTRKIVEKFDFGPVGEIITSMEELKALPPRTMLLLGESGIDNADYWTHVFETTRNRLDADNPLVIIASAQTVEHCQGLIEG